MCVPPLRRPPLSSPQEAEALFRRVLAATEAALGADHAQALTSAANLASLLQEHGGYWGGCMWRCVAVGVAVGVVAGGRNGGLRTCRGLNHRTRPPALPITSASSHTPQHQTSRDRAFNLSNRVDVTRSTPLPHSRRQARGG